MIGIKLWAEQGISLEKLREERLLLLEENEGSYPQGTMKILADRLDGFVSNTFYKAAMAA